MKPVIKLDNVTKNYGSSVGIQDVNLEVEKGAVFGFLGPNGAGKSTTINMLVDLIRPTKGSISVFGLDSQKDSLEIRRRVGFLSGDMALDEKLTGLQQLTYFANIRGNVSQKRIKELAKLLELNLNRRIKTLSRVNRQKVGLISALMHDPELLILDEPTSGLDPLIQAEFNKIILDHKKRGKTTFVSSHVLSEIQEICDHVAFVKEGKLIDVRHMKDITQGFPKNIRITSKDKSVADSVKRLSGAKVLPPKGHVLSVTYSGDINDLLALLSKHQIVDISIQDADLETVFMGYYGGGNV